MSKLSKLEWDIIDSRVNSTKIDHNLVNESIAFLWLVLEQFFPGRVDERLESITDGGNDKGIDAIQIIENETSAEVFLFQSKYRVSSKTTSKTINDSETLRVASFLEDLFDKSPELENSGNRHLHEWVQRIWELHSRGLYCRYRIVFCSNDQGLSVSADKIMRAVCEKHEQISFEHYDSENLLSDLASKERASGSGMLQVVGKEVFERTDGDVRGVIASIDALSFIDLISNSDRTSVKRYLFDDNLRVFLGANGGYNQSIIRTATSRDSHLFWYLNNGITITCKNYSYNKGHANPVINVEDLQIVNGAQTSHSLVEAYRVDPEALNNVVLMVRIYATDRMDISEKVAVATNSQARIQGRDLRANLPVMKKLEMAFLENGYFFERKRGMHASQPSGKRIDALKLGQVIMSYFLDEPHKARSGSDSIFGHRFFQIFHHSYDVDELCRLFELFQMIEQKREAYHSSFEGEIKQGGEYRYLNYGYWFVLYAAKLLLWKSGKDIPKGKKADDLIDEAIRLVAKACDQTKTVAHYQLFRSSKTKDKILQEFSGKQGSLFDDIPPTT